MHSTLCRSTDVALNDYGVQAHALLVEDNYDTAPIALTKVTYQAPNEEELHLSFEEAIDSRAIAVQEQLSRLRSTDSLPDVGSSSVNVSLGKFDQERPLSLLSYGWRRGMIFGGLAILFTLIGFNLMGLLVLFTR